MPRAAAPPPGRRVAVGPPCRRPQRARFRQNLPLVTFRGAFRPQTLTRGRFCCPRPRPASTAHAVAAAFSCVASKLLATHPRLFFERRIRFFNKSNDSSTGGFAICLKRFDTKSRNPVGFVFDSRLGAWDFFANRGECELRALETVPNCGSDLEARQEWSTLPAQAIALMRLLRTGLRPSSVRGVASPLVLREIRWRLEQDFVAVSLSPRGEGYSFEASIGMSSMRPRDAFMLLVVSRNAIQPGCLRASPRRLPTDFRFRTRYLTLMASVLRRWLVAGSPLASETACGGFPTRRTSGGGHRA